MKYLYPLLIGLISLLLGWQLLRPGYFPMHDDLQVMRLYQMDRCFQDGQIPCRWSPDMANNYGQAMFNYYSAFPYYLGQLIHQLGFSYVNTVKALFLLSLILSGLFVYWFVSQLSSKKAAFIAAVIYLTSPYHALDIFVRGAISEIWGISLLPAVLACLTWLIRKPSLAKVVLLSLSLAAFLTSHNLTSLISAPIILLTAILVWIFYPHKRRTFFYLLSAGLLGIGLSAFFSLPLAFERDLIQSQSLTADYFNFRAHFVSLKQLFANFSWGYGPSKFGADDDISFAVGLVNSLVLLLTPISAFLLLKKKQLKQLSLLLFFFGLSLFSIFMTHAKSIAIWDSLPFLAFVQFPWRFLGPAMLASSLALGFQFSLLPKKLITAILIGLSAFLLLFNLRYFKFEKYWPWIDDTQKLSGELYNLQVRAAITDYLPVGATVPEQLASQQPQVIGDGIVSVNYFDKRSAYFASEVDVLSDEATLQFPIMYFPGWTLYHNTQPDGFDSDNKLKLITLELSNGHHLIQAWFENTPIRTLGNLTTFVSSLVLLSLLTIKPSPKTKNQG